MSTEREIIMLEKQLNEMKAKLNNAIIDMRAVNYYGWVYSDDMTSRKWAPVRYEVQYKRQGDPGWVSLPVIDRDDIDPTVPNGELEE